jgi:dihydrofolate reductase
MSRNLIVKMSMSLDGFVGGPNGEADWLFRSSDEESTAWTVDVISRAGIHAMGRKSWHDMAAYWPTSMEPFAPPMNKIPKVVFTRTGLGAGGGPTAALTDARAQGHAQKSADPEVVRGWTNPRVASGDLAEEVRRLKAESGGDVIAHGGASFVRALIETGLVDEYALLVAPVVLGRGLPIFSKPMDLELVELKRFPKGTVAHVYRARR